MVLTRRLRLSVSATIVVVSIVVVCAGWAVGTLGDGWAAQCLASRVTRLAGAAVLGGLVALYLLAGAMWRLAPGRNGGRRQPGDAGTAAIEFALLFPVALCIVLVMIQSALVVSGNMAVYHAAYAAARTAVVRVPQKVSDDEPRNVVASPDSSAKIHHILAAAVYAVMPVSAGKIDLGGAGDATVIRQGLERFYRLYDVEPPNWLSTALTAKYRYAWNYTDVSLSPPANGYVYGDHETLRVRVRHTLYLSVPYANRLFGRELPGLSGQYGTDVQATCALTNQGVEDEINIEVFPRYVQRGGV